MKKKTLIGLAATTMLAAGALTLPATASADSFFGFGSNGSFFVSLSNAFGGDYHHHDHWRDSREGWGHSRYEGRDHDSRFNGFHHDRGHRWRHHDNRGWERHSSADFHHHRGDYRNRDGERH